LSERSNEDVVRAYFAAHKAHDQDALTALRHPDWTLEWPQSRERIRGDANDRGMAASYPGGLPDFDTRTVVGAEDRWVVTPLLTIQRVVGSGDQWWADGTVRYPDGSMWFILVMAELRDGKIYRETGYFAPPLDPPEWRAAWVETIA
jgi:hypothetical protein